MKKLSLTALWFAFTAFLTLSGPLQAAPRYNYHDLGTLGGNYSDAFDINRDGQVVGEAKDENSLTAAFLKEPDQPMQHLGFLPGGQYSRAFAVNNRGQVVGFAMDADGFTLWGFLKEPGSKMTSLGALGGNGSAAFDIDDDGQVVGWANDADGVSWAFLKPYGQDMQNLGALGEGVGGGAFALRDRAVVGWAYTAKGFFHAFWISSILGSEMLDLGTLGGFWSSALGINDNGQIVGWSTDAEHPNDSSIKWAFFMKSKGHAMENLGALGGDSSEAWAINNSSQVVGVAYDMGVETAFLWEKGVIYDLNALTVDLPAGVVLAKARAINDRGWIVGRARVGGNVHAFLLKPLTVPSSALPSILGLLLLDPPRLP